MPFKKRSPKSSASKAKATARAVAKKPLKRKTATPKANPRKSTPKKAEEKPGDDLLDIIPFRVSKPPSLYMRHKALVHGIIDKVKGDATLKKNALKALRTAIHAKRNVSFLNVERQDVHVIRTITDEHIVYDIHTTRLLQQLCHKLKQPAIFQHVL